MSLVILQPGEKLESLAHVTGDFADWVISGMGVSSKTATRLYPHRGDLLPDRATAIVITGSSALVTDRADWMTSGAAWLREKVAEGVPVLGICFGHQWLGEALGGRVDINPRGTEVGTVPVYRTPRAADDPLLGILPSPASLPVSHRQSVTSLPPGAVHLASSDLDPHQAFRIGARAWGVQFHPEFSAEITRSYLDYHAERITAAGRDPRQLKNAVTENTFGRSILQRFADIAGIA